MILNLVAPKTGATVDLRDGSNYSLLGESTFQLPKNEAGFSSQVSDIQSPPRLTSLNGQRQDRLVVRVYGTSKTDLSDNLKALKAVVDEINLYGSGSLSYIAPGGTATQTLEISGASYEITQWGERAETRDVATVTITLQTGEAWEGGRSRYSNLLLNTTDDEVTVTGTAVNATELYTSEAMGGQAVLMNGIEITGGAGTITVDAGDAGLMNAYTNWRQLVLIRGSVSNNGTDTLTLHLTSTVEVRITKTAGVTTAQFFDTGTAITGSNSAVTSGGDWLEGWVVMGCQNGLYYAGCMDDDYIGSQPLFDHST